MSGTSILTYLVLSLSVLYAFVYPAFGDLSLLNEKKQNLDHSLEQVANIEKKKSDLLTAFNQISAEDKKNIDTVLPNSLDFVRLMSQISSVAENYGIVIDQISSKDSGNISAGDTVENAEPEKAYESSLISFTFHAPYQTFKSFMSELERSLRIMDIRSMRLETQENGVYSYTVEFEVYWLPTT